MNPYCRHVLVAGTLLLLAAACTLDTRKGGSKGGGEVPLPGQPGGVCTGALVTARHVTPTVIALVDQSGSMRDPFNLAVDGGPSRWVLLRRELVGTPDPASPRSRHSLLHAFDATVRFGVHFYTSHGVQCPSLIWIPPAIHNYQTIRGGYLAGCQPGNPPVGCMLQPGGGTPTAETLDATTNRLIATGDLSPFGPDITRDPVIYILATDGNPHPCDRTQPHTDTQRVENQVALAYSLGVKTYVISLAKSDPARLAHLQRVANIGVGRLPNDPIPAPYWEPLHDAQLREALQAIVGGAVTCEVKLNGEVRSTNHCQGVVTLNGQPLPCEDPNGWSLANPSTVILQGAACDQLQIGSAVVDVKFPCGVNVVLL